MGYIEAHGTGTKLGDPIEIEGLKMAFKRYTDKAGFCAVGSAKAHIGHLEGAAGVAGVIKAILSMKNGQIPAMPMFSTLNPYIKLDDSPLFINEECIPWTKNDSNPRCAGVSSFGFGGAYAHVVIEEYEESGRRMQGARREQKGDALIILSAMDKDRLREYIGEIVTYLKGPEVTEGRLDLGDMAYTLQLGREAMEERIAVVVKNADELNDKLMKYLGGETNLDGLHSGNTRVVRDKNGVIGNTEEEREFVSNLFKKNNLNKLAALWVNGSDIDWELFYKDRGAKPQRISLPTYPFKREHYWIPAGAGGAGAEGSLSRLHDLLDSNESTLSEQRYRKELRGSEYYLRDHVVGGDKVLPGVVYLEIVRLAGELAGEGSKVKRIKDIVWQQPVRVEGGKVEVYVSLYPGDVIVEYEVSSGGGKVGERVVNSQGKIEYGKEGEITDGERIDLAAIRSRCTESKDKETCYKIFRERGLTYGPSFQAISRLENNDRESLAELRLPAEVRGNFGEYVLHPSLMDGAMQTVMGLMGDGSGGTYVPYSLGEVEIIRPLEEKCYSYVQVAEGSKGGIKRFDIVIAKESGEVLVRLKNFVVRLYSKEMMKAGKASEGLIYLGEEWREAGIVGEREPISGAVLLVNGSESVRAELQGMVGDRGRVVEVRYGEGYKELGEGVYEVSAGVEGDYLMVVDGLRGKDIQVDKVVYLWDGEGFGEVIEEAGRGLERGIYSLYSLTRALMEGKPKGDVKVLCVSKGDGVNPLISGISGFGKSVNLENPKFKYKVITLGSAVSSEDMAKVIGEELGIWGEKVFEVKYDGEKRYERKLKEVEIEGIESAVPVLKEGGVYVITGGMGGLGAIFARYLSKEYKAKLVLSDVRDLDSKGEALLEGDRSSWWRSLICQM